MNEQTTGKLSENALKDMRERDRKCSKILAGEPCKVSKAEDRPMWDRAELLSHIDYQAAEIERLTKEIAAATAKLDALKVDPAKRDELIAGCHDRFQAAFPEGFRFLWRAHGEQFRAGFAAAVDHAFSAGRASAPEVADLQRQLEEVNARLAELTKPTDEQELAKIGAEAHHRHLIEKCGHDPKLMFNWEKWPEASRSANIAATTAVAARVRAPLLQQIAELTAKLLAAESDMNSLITAHETDKSQLIGDRDRLAAELGEAKESIAYNRDYEGERHELAAELAEAKRALATLTDERDRARDALRQAEAGVAAVRQALAEARAERERLVRFKDAAIAFDADMPPMARIFVPQFGALCSAWKRLERERANAAPLTAAEFAELGKVLDAEAAAEKVEPPASEARRFVCPKCGGHFCERRADGSTRCLGVGVLAWSGCPASASPEPGSMKVESGAGEGESAKGEQSEHKTPELIFSAGPLRNACQAGWHSARGEASLVYPCAVAARNEAQKIVDEAKEARDARARLEIVPGSSETLREKVDGLRQQLAAERQAREAADRQATEKILELERRCNDEHFKCEAAEQRAERLQRKCNAHVEEITEHIKRADALRQEMANDQKILHDQNYWRWQGDGRDYPESLTCQVVMTADQLRELLQRAEQAEIVRDSWKRSFESQNGEIKRLSDAMADSEDAIERLREIGNAIGCGHVGDPDGRRQIVNCVEQTVQELEQRAEQAEAAAGVMRQALKLAKEDLEYDAQYAVVRGTGVARRVDHSLAAVKAALATDAGRAAADELRALRAISARLANACIGLKSCSLPTDISGQNMIEEANCAVAEYQALAGQSETGKETK